MTPLEVVSKEAKDFVATYAAALKGVTRKSWDAETLLKAELTPTGSLTAGASNWLYQPSTTYAANALITS